MDVDLDGLDDVVALVREGVNGSGDCYCKDSDLDPDHYCEHVSDIEMSHLHEEEMHLGFIFLILVGFACTFLLYAYNRIEALEIFPESIAAIILGIVIGCVLRYFYNGSRLL